jgi:hypothetical protein
MLAAGYWLLKIELVIYCASEYLQKIQKSTSRELFFVLAERMGDCD